MTTRPTTETAFREDVALVQEALQGDVTHAQMTDVQAAFERLSAAVLRERPSDAALVEALRQRAAKEPLGVDISDYSDEFCIGFLHGQVNALDALAAARPDALAPSAAEPTSEEER